MKPRTKNILAVPLFPLWLLFVGCVIILALLYDTWQALWDVVSGTWLGQWDCFRIKILGFRKEELPHRPWDDFDEHGHLLDQ